MKRIGIGFPLVACVVTLGCGTSRSSADTTNAAASSTSVSGAASVVDTNHLNLGGAASSSTSKTAAGVKRATSTTKSSSKSDSRTQKAVERDSVLRYDSVIRGPVKMLPTATSTPSR